jgi:hypothetical protein
VARAQQAERVWRIVVLIALAESDAEGQRAVVHTRPQLAAENF